MIMVIMVQTRGVKTPCSGFFFFPGMCKYDALMGPSYTIPNLDLGFFWRDNQ